MMTERAQVPQRHAKPRDRHLRVHAIPSDIPTTGRTACSSRNISHNSMSCPNKSIGHQDNAKADNHMGGYTNIWTAPTAPAPVEERGTAIKTRSSKTSPFATEPPCAPSPPSSSLAVTDTAYTEHYQYIITGLSYHNKRLSNPQRLTQLQHHALEPHSQSPVTFLFNRSAHSPHFP
jgi:hypothetical protein